MVENVDVPPETDWVPRVVVPSLKVTLPLLGVKLPSSRSVTVAVSVRLDPAASVDAEAISAVEVGAEDSTILGSRAVSSNVSRDGLRFVTLDLRRFGACAFEWERFTDGSSKMKRHGHSETDFVPGRAYGEIKKSANLRGRGCPTGAATHRGIATRPMRPVAQGETSFITPDDDPGGDRAGPGLTGL